LKHLAIVIPLSGSILTQTIECWEVLSRKYNIKYHSSHSACPHITITSGDCSDEEEFRQVVYSCLSKCSSITIQANGLGIFVKEAPVIYIRWFLSRELKSMCILFQDGLSNVWSRISNSSVKEIWLPKSTLALNDISYEQLPSILKELNMFDFEQSMEIEKITLLEIDRKEKIIDEINLS
jgi:hypothetical protein